MAKPDGGRAFPSGKIDAGSCWEDFPYLGMSLRDYLAAQAMAACIGADSHANQNYSAAPAKVATYAYEFADAMLKEREK